MPHSSYGATSPGAGTSPLASFGAHSTSPQNASLLSGGFSGSQGRKTSGNVFQSFARQLTAFLPNTYPLAEQDENGEAKAKRHGKLRILLLENINVDASDFLKKQGYEVGPSSFSGKHC
jgi:D-3-phosphoglycerate dehydrogenase